jgi:signal transduction histidine kinase
VIRNAEGEPAGLDALIADLRAETADRVELAGLAFHWTTGPMRSDPPRRGAVQTLRAVVREAVSNALRHAGASSLTIEVSGDGEAIRLRIVDDGKGFTTGLACAPGSGGRGLGNMRDRVEALGGRFDLETGSKGTRIEAVLPVF